MPPKPTVLESIQEKVDVRLHGDASLPTVVYLPGLHGNWTLIGAFRSALKGRLRFVEITYPPTVTWSLIDYADGVEKALAEHGIEKGCLLAESFGSQVAWPMIERKKFEAEALILAGGFVQHPFRSGVRFAERVCRDISFTLLTRVLFGYARLARWRFRHSPETRRSIEEFISRLTEAERQAAKHRLHLVAESDLCAIAQKVSVPVYGVAGLFDPVVPWFLARRWLQQNCKALREFKIIWFADHNVLGTGAQAAADCVVRWVTERP